MVFQILSFPLQLCLCHSHWSRRLFLLILLDFSHLLVTLDTWILYMVKVLLLIDTGLAMAFQAGITKVVLFASSISIGIRLVAGLFTSSATHDATAVNARFLVLVVVDSPDEGVS